MESQQVTRLSDNSAGLVLVSAWNDSGGGLLTRLLDGHTRLRGWPFELLLGTAGTNDTYAGTIHDKYRWPRFDMAAGSDCWFEAICDMELKAVLTGAAPPRFDAYRLPVELADWRAAFRAWQMPARPDRRDIVAAYIDSWFRLCDDNPAADHVLGHCPSLILDADMVLSDFPAAKIVHVIREPAAGLGDFRRRHQGFPVDLFAARWSLVNGAALAARLRNPGSVQILRYEDLRDAREASLRRVLDFLGLPFESTTLTPSWRGQALSDQNLGPFGGVGAVSRVYDAAMRDSVLEHEKEELRNATAAIYTALEGAV